MITDRDTNFVYFSEWITTRWKYWPNIEDALRRENVFYGFLSRYSKTGTPLSRDIWARDYMPLQIDEGIMLGYIYNPDYLNTPAEDRDYISNYEAILKSKNMTVTRKTNLVIDGGNMVKCGDKIIMTDKIFSENRHLSKKDVIDELSQKTGAKIIIIPPDPSEVLKVVQNDKGESIPFSLQHADGLVRWVKDDVVLVNKSSHEYTSSLLSSLKMQGLECELLDYSVEGKYVSVNSWCYINFLHVGNKIFVPCYDGKEQEIALKRISDAYPDCKVVPVNIKGILRDGGGLNCISWNIKL